MRETSLRIALVTTCVLSLLMPVHSNALDLGKIVQDIKNKAQQNASSNSNSSSGGNSSSSSSTSSGNSSSNTYQSQRDPSRESVKKYSAILAAKNAGIPVDVKETVDGQERVGKEDVLTEALTKTVAKVYPDLGIPAYNLYYTYSEFQRNITNPAYGLINKFDKTEKLNVYTMMNQPDPQKNTWSITANANINTKLSDENIHKIREDSRIIYTQGGGGSFAQSRASATLNAVMQYHQINIVQNSPVTMNMMNPNYGLVEKVEVLNEIQDKNTGMFISKLKVTMSDMTRVDPAKFQRISMDMDASKMKEGPNPVLESLVQATNEVSQAQTVIEGALGIKVMSEAQRRDAIREKAGIRFGDNDFQWRVSMTEERWAVIEERIKGNPKIDEQQKQEYVRGQKMMIPAYTKALASGARIFTSLSSGGNPFQSLQALIQFPRLMAANSEGMNSMITFNTNQGVDNTELKTKVADLNKDI